MPDTHSSSTPYLPADRRTTPPAEELRARIPGWGVDLDPAVRPSVPQELHPSASGDGVPPVQQEQRWPRERSIEHARLTPVFGTSCPPRGLSGALRKLAYARYSEARAAHWLLLLAADRVDSKAHALRSFVSLRPDQPLTQTGVLSERRRHGLSSRVGRGRADVGHHLLDPLLVGLPWALGAWLAHRIARRAVRAGAARADA